MYISDTHDTQTVQLAKRMLELSGTPDRASFSGKLAPVLRSLAEVLEADVAAPDTTVARVTHAAHWARSLRCEADAQERRAGYLFRG